MRANDVLRTINKSDLVGFSYGDRHSSQFGLYRVSSGNRYTEYLSPTLKNTTTEVSGMDGVLYFGTNKGSRAFSINMAFSGVKEADLRDIKEWLSGGTPRPLIFDERPYVEYMCVVSSSPTFQYLMFEEEGERVYKGELTVGFLCYMGYGLSVPGKKFAEDFLEENFDEWADSSEIPYKDFVNGDTTGTYDKFDNGALWVYNAGNLETDYELVLYVDSATATISSNQGFYTFTMPTKTNGGNAFKVSINSKLQFAYAEEVKITDENVVVVKDKVLLIPDGEKELFKLPCGRSKITYSPTTYDSLNTITYRHRYM